LTKSQKYSIITGMKKFIASLVGVAFAILIPLNPAVLAQTQSTNSAYVGSAKNQKQHTSHKFIKLGKKTDPQSGKVVEGIAIVELKDGASVEEESISQELQLQMLPITSSQNCYKFTSTLTRWKNPEPWVFNATNSEGLNKTTLYNKISASISQWEDAADRNLDGLISKDIIGAGTQTSETLTGTLNGKNEVFFANPNYPGAIAVTTIWGFFNEIPQNREIVEWDMVLDGVNYDWATNGDAQKYDFENITTHELGHVIGLDHPDSSCTESTMYASTVLGEIKKRTLEPQDTQGVWQLYVDAQTDSDGDGFSDRIEQYTQTNPFLACGIAAWPPDFNNDTAINSGDQLKLVRQFGGYGTTNYLSRYDLNADGATNSGDQLLLAALVSKRCQI